MRDQDSKLPAIRTYKTLLRAAVERCPAGTKQKIAKELGTSRSFVSQIFNPAYSVPVPAKHLNTLIKLCALTQSEETAFRSAHLLAHPPPASDGGRRKQNEICIPLPKFENADQRRAVEQAILASAEAIIKVSVGDAGGKGGS